MTGIGTPAVVDGPKSSIRLDIGCGKNKKAGFIGVDQYAMEGVDYVLDVKNTPWTLCKPEEMIDADGAAITLALMDPAYRAEHYPPIADGSVEEVHCSHFLEHLTGKERVQFLNELHRVMATGAKATIITPHWGSNRAYGDFTHQWPPVAEMFWYYLDADWRKTQAPHTDKAFNPEGYTCNFSATWGYGMHPQIIPKHAEAQQFAMTFYKEAVQDMHCTLVKK